MDLINRQVAIELIHSLYPSAPIMRMNRKRWEKKYKPYIEAEKALEQLPSTDPEPSQLAKDIARILENDQDMRVILKNAETEIVRCMDCKHLQKWRSEESAKKFGQVYGCARGVLRCPEPGDFCSYAKRRAYGTD